MRYLGVTLPEIGRKITVHVDENNYIGELLREIQILLEVEGDGNIVYHVNTGRFCPENYQIWQCGIESGDSIMIFDRSGRR